jgi:Asp-tRNA(Asn)/Glu-tRNA(Gln) amidotransferase A subunit family amidase
MNTTCHLGLQVSGRLYEDGKLMAAAHALEQAFSAWTQNYVARNQT